MNKFLLSSDTKILSVKVDKLVNLENQSELSFINHGVDNVAGISTNAILTGVTDVVKTNQILGVGKTFTHTINLDKYKGKSITL